MLRFTLKEIFGIAVSAAGAAFVIYILVFLTFVFGGNH